MGKEGEREREREQEKRDEERGSAWGVRGQERGQARRCGACRETSPLHPLSQAGFRSRPFCDEAVECLRMVVNATVKSGTAPKQVGPPENPDHLDAVHSHRLSLLC